MSAKKLKELYDAVNLSASQGGRAPRYVTLNFPEAKVEICVTTTNAGPSWYATALAVSPTITDRGDTAAEALAKVIDQLITVDWVKIKYNFEISLEVKS